MLFCVFDYANMVQVVRQKDYAMGLRTLIATKGKLRRVSIVQAKAD